MSTTGFDAWREDGEMSALRTDQRYKQLMTRSACHLFMIVVAFGLFSCGLLQAEEMKSMDRPGERIGLKLKTEYAADFAAGRLGRLPFQRVDEKTAEAVLVKGKQVFVLYEPSAGHDLLGTHPYRAYLFLLPGEDRDRHYVVAKGGIAADLQVLGPVD